MVDLPVGPSSRLYHIAFEQDWIDAQSTGEYGVSTPDRQLGDVGYIPASFAHQVHLVGSFLYQGTSDPMVVLVIDPTRMTTLVHVESVEGWGETFPLIAGPLPTDAVVEVLRARFDGTEFVVDGLPPYQ